MKQIKKLISLITIISIMASAFMYMPVANALRWDNDNAPQLVDQNSAYVIFGTNNQTRGLTVTGTTTPVTYDGITGAQLATNQTMNITLDSSMLNSKYLVVVKFYDPGVNEEEFKFTYSGGTHKIRKTGMEAKWVTESFVLDNMSNVSSFTVSSNTYKNVNAPVVISKIEIVKYEGPAGTADISPKLVTGSDYDYITLYSGILSWKTYKPLIRPYATNQSWNYQGTKFIFKSYDPSVSNSPHTMYEYDIVNNKVTLLDTGISIAAKGEFDAVVTYDNQIYYSKTDSKEWKMDWLTYTTKQTPSRSYSTPSVSNDGKFISGDIGTSSRQLMVSNLLTGENKTFSVESVRNSWASGSWLSHPMINPEYPHLHFFAHDSNETKDVHDRMWLVNYNTNGDAYNMFVQVPETNSSKTAEPSGHEVWGADGKYMYWVKYRKDGNVGQSGLMRTDRYGSSREYINDDYQYWHCFPSMDNNFVIADTNSGPQIVLVDTNTYKSTLLAQFTAGDWTHPNQPHPHISGNNYSADWQMASAKDYNSTCISWAIVRDITKNVKIESRYPIGKGAEIVSCEGAVNYVTDETLDGVKYKKASSTNGVYVDILNDVCASTNADVTLEISYLDNGTSSLLIKYTKGVSDIYDLATRETSTSYALTKSGTNQLKTATVTLSGVNINSIGKFRSDFYLTSTDGVYINSVNVISATPEAQKPSSDELYIQNMYYNLNDGTVKNEMKAGDTASPVAIVASNLNRDVNVDLYRVVYNADKSIKSISKSDTVTVKANEASLVTTSETSLKSGETQRIFVWNSSLRPIKTAKESLGVVISFVSGKVKLSCNKSSGYFINVYSNGEIVGRTNGSYCMLDDMKKGDNKIIVDIADRFGRVISRSNPITVNLK